MTIVNKGTEKLTWMLGAVVLVLFIGFITFLITTFGLILDATRFKTETYQNLVNKVSEQNTIVERMARELEIQRIQNGLTTLENFE